MKLYHLRVKYMDCDDDLIYFFVLFMSLECSEVPGNFINFIQDININFSTILLDDSNEIMSCFSKQMGSSFFFTSETGNQKEPDLKENLKFRNRKVKKYESALDDLRFKPKKKKSGQKNKKKMSAEEQKKNSIREIKKWYGKAQIIYFIVEFMKHEFRNSHKQIEISTIEQNYPNSDTKKSYKYVIHLWFNLVNQGLAEKFLQFMKEILLIHENTMENNYKDKPQCFLYELSNEIERIYKCFEGYQNDCNLANTIYEIYDLYKGKKAHKTNQNNAIKCLRELGQFFPDFQNVISI